MKKTLTHPLADAKLRLSFNETIQAYLSQGTPLVYLDESGFAKDAPRTHGYAPIGQRCYDSHPWKAYGQRTNAIGALLGFSLLTVSLFDHSIDALTFECWLTQDLLPQLPKDCVIIMDNAAFHKTQAIQSLIKAAGHRLQYLPPYSPDLNPIEKKWAQAKAIRRATRCNIEELFLGPYL